MLDLIVLGQLPGTEIRLGFIPIMILFEIGFIAYLVHRYPAQAKKVTRAVKTIFSKKKNQIAKILSRSRQDVLGPETKLLK